MLLKANQIKGILIGIIIFVAIASGFFFYFMYWRYSISLEENTQIIYWAKNSLSSEYTSVGDVWAYEVQSKSKRQITSNEKIYSFYEISPDQKYLAISLIDPTAKIDIVYDLAVVNLIDGKTQRLVSNLGYEPEMVSWISNNEIVYLEQHYSDYSINKINLTDHSNSKFISSPSSSVTGWGFSLSSNGKTLAGNYLGGDEVGNSLFIMDTDSNLIRYPVVGNNQFFRGWFGDGFVYSTIRNGRQNISKINIDGVENTKLFEIQSEDIGDFTAAKKSPVFMLSTEQKTPNKLFLYSDKSHQYKEIKLPTVFLDSFDVSADGEFSVIMVSDPGLPSRMYLVNLKLEQWSEICDIDCTDPRLIN